MSNFAIMAPGTGRTLEELDKEDWGAPQFESGLVLKIYALRKKQLSEFTIEDLRILIGQNINLEILLPMAIAKLEENILAEGDFYEGDLLHSVLSSDMNYWQNHEGQWKLVKRLYESSKSILEPDDSFRQIRKKFEAFNTRKKQE